MSLLVTPIKNHKFRMAIKLHGIVVLSTKYTDVSTNDWSNFLQNLEYSPLRRMHILTEQWQPLKNLGGWNGCSTSKKMKSRILAKISKCKTNLASYHPTAVAPFGSVHGLCSMIQYDIKLICNQICETLILKPSHLTPTWIVFWSKLLPFVPDGTP